MIAGARPRPARSVARRASWRTPRPRPRALPRLTSTRTPADSVSRFAQRPGILHEGREAARARRPEPPAQIYTAVGRPFGVVHAPTGVADSPAWPRCARTRRRPSGRARRRRRSGSETPSRWSRADRSAVVVGRGPCRRWCPWRVRRWATGPPRPRCPRILVPPDVVSAVPELHERPRADRPVATHVPIVWSLEVSLEASRGVVRPMYSPSTSCVPSCEEALQAQRRRDGRRDLAEPLPAPARRASPHR